VGGGGYWWWGGGGGGGVWCGLVSRLGLVGWWFR